MSILDLSKIFAKLDTYLHIYSNEANMKIDEISMKISKANIFTESTNEFNDFLQTQDDTYTYTEWAIYSNKEETSATLNELEKRKEDYTTILENAQSNYISFVEEMIIDDVEAKVRYLENHATTLDLGNAFDNRPRWISTKRVSALNTVQTSLQNIQKTRDTIKKLINDGSYVSADIQGSSILIEIEKINDLYNKQNLSTMDTSTALNTDASHLTIDDLYKDATVAPLYIDISYEDLPDGINRLDSATHITHAISYTQPIALRSITNPTVKTKQELLVWQDAILVDNTLTVAIADGVENLTGKPAPLYLTKVLIDTDGDDDPEEYYISRHSSVIQWINKIPPMTSAEKKEMTTWIMNTMKEVEAARHTIEQIPTADRSEDLKKLLPDIVAIIEGTPEKIDLHTTDTILQEISDSLYNLLDRFNNTINDTP